MPRKPKQTKEQTKAQPNRSKKRTRKQESGIGNRESVPIDGAMPKSKLQATKLKTQNSKLKTPELTPEQTALIEEFRSRYPFPLDEFQEEAIARLVMDESVMVAAPTGTGKTVLAEF